MATPIFTNNAVGVLAASYGAGATAITLSGGQGNKFPAPGAGEWFPVTVVDASNTIEIMRCTARAADTLTVVRGQEGTLARALGAGERVEHRLTAQAIKEILSAPLTAAQIPNGFITGPMIAAGAITTGKIALGAVGGDQLFQGRFIHEGFLDVGAALANLGFTPVQQGGITGMGANKVILGWATAAPFKLKLNIDNTDQGNILTEKHDGTVNSAGYRGLVQNVQNANYTFGLVDSGRQVLHTGGAHTYTIPADAPVPLLIGSVIKVVNREGVGPITINAAAGVNLIWVPSGAVGARTLTSPCTVVLEKMDGNNWWIYGNGIT